MLNPKLAIDETVPKVEKPKKESKFKVATMFMGMDKKVKTA